MRLIDADAMTSKIQKQYCEDCDRRKGENNGKRYMVYEIGDAPCRACSIDDMYAELYDAPTIHPEPHWIPVTERLPEKRGEYLVTVKWVTGESDVDVYEYDARHKTWNDGESAGGERAVAWCNLPEPYKGVTE